MQYLHVIIDKFSVIALKLQRLLCMPHKGSGDVLWCAKSFQGSSWPVFCHGVAIIAASLSVMRGVATIEPVNKVIVPVLLGIVTFSFYWALFLPGAADGIIHMFRPHWGEFWTVRFPACGTSE